MASRSKTLVFLQFRASFSREHTASRRARQPNNTRDTDEAAGLINRDSQDDDVVVEMAVLPPRWVEIVDEVDQDIAKIKIKIAELEQMHKKHLLPGFSDDRIGNEQNIERFAEQITNLFRGAQRKIKKIEQESSRDKTNAQNQKFGRNIQMGLAAKLQDVSGVFRKAQSAYLKKLRGRETRSKDFQSNLPAVPSGADGQDDDEDLDAVFTDAQLDQVQNNEREITQREQEINQIVKSINGLAEIFKELQTMVIDQGTVLDRIDYNIEQTGVYMEDAHVQLQQGAKYQEKTKAKLCIILLALIVFILVVIIFYKVVQRK
ncbi:t-SNARE [Chytriomyces sp. MP71]|nr:t-SNARE [Chytriomyces sp. MP71]